MSEPTPYSGSSVPRLPLSSEALERLAKRGGGNDSGGMDGLIRRVEVLEKDVGEIKAALGRLEPMIIRIDATMPFLATKADLAEKPGKGYLWTVLAVLVGAIIAAFAAGIALPPLFRQ